MRKFLLVGAAALVVAFLVLFLVVQPFGSSGGVPVPEDGRLCRELPPEEIDFTILNEIYQIAKVNSVKFKDIEDDAGVLLREGITAVFDKLGVPPVDIPPFVWDEIDAELAKKDPDFTVIQRIFERLRDDPAFRDNPAFEDFQNPALAREFFRTAIDGVIVRGLKDPFAHYTDPEALRLGASDLSGQYQGVGMSHKLEGGHFYIEEVFPGQPAEQAGMRTGDEELAVDGKTLEGCSSQAFTQAVRGREGTTVVLSVKRGDGSVEDVAIKRGVISIAVISSCPGYPWPDNRGKSDRGLLDCPLRDEHGERVDDILYIKFEIFNEVAADDLAAVLRSADLSQFRGIILDLRANPGGRVDILMRTLDYFFKDRVLFKTTDFSRREFVGGLGIVDVRETDEGLWRAFYAYDRFDYAPDIPLVILVGPDPNSTTRKGVENNSFSAAEGFIGAMQDHGRAVVIGEGRTGGKGTTVIGFPLRDGKAGEVTIAIGLWHTPAGRTPQGEDIDGDGHEDTGGLMPDIVVSWTDEDYRAFNNDRSWDPVMHTAIRVLRGAEQPETER